MAKKNPQTLRDKLQSLWKNSVTEYGKMTKEAQKLLKKGEKNWQQISQKSQDRLEAVNLSIKKEKLCYQMGKTLSRLPKNLWTKTKKVDAMVKEIKGLTKKIKKLNK